MAERQSTKPEIAAQKKTIKFTPAIGDWTTYKPAKILVRKVKSGLYGFDRLSQKELDLFLLIHYRFIEDLLKKLKIDLNLSAELYSASVEQTTYQNCLRGLVGPVVQAKLGSAMLTLDLALANSIINHSLGSHDLETLDRGLTDSENSVLATTLAEYISGYAKAFDNVVANPSVSLVGSPDAANDGAIGSSSTFVSFTAEIALADNQPGRIMIGYLAGTIKELLQKFRAKMEQQPLNFKKLPAALLAGITSPVKVTLGSTTLTSNEIHKLEPGDVVTLDTSINASIPISIGNKLKIFCQPGQKVDKAAIRIAAVRDESVKIAPPVVETIVEEEPVPAPTPAPASPAAKPLPPIEEDLEEEDEEEDFLAEDDLEDDDDFSLEDDDFKL